MTQTSPWPQYAHSLPEMFFERANKWPDHIALRHKKDGAWLDITWCDLENRVLTLAAGLRAAGIKERGIVSILSGNRPEWVIADFAVLTLNAMDVPIYPTNTAAQVAYILNDSGAEMVFVENKMQLEKIMQEKDSLPKLRKVVVIEPFEEKDDFITDLDTLMKLGEQNQDPDGLKTGISVIDPESIATLIYTSGTTGNPKGVMLCHRNFVSNVLGIKDYLDFEPGEHDLQFLPICHSFGRAEIYVMLFYQGTICFAESIERIPDNFLEIRPHIFVTVPRLLEKVHEKISAGLEEASPLKRGMFNWAMGVGKKMTAFRMEKKSPCMMMKLKFSIADKLVFSNIKARLGGRMRTMVYAAAPLALEIQEFFAATGIRTLEAYGLTETSPGVTGNKPENFRLGTVGTAWRDTDIKIADDGEILVRGPQVMLGYWNLPEATEEALEGGWFHTGDIGEIDNDGFLKITDRKKDLIITAGGKNIAPQNIENLFKMDTAIEQFAVVGDQRKYLVALIVPNFEWLTKWAAEKNLPTDPKKLINEPDVINEYQRRINEKNRELAKYETIKKFALLPEEFNVENGMLTPTMKVRRKNVMSNFHNLIESMYPKPS